MATTPACTATSGDEDLQLDLDELINFEDDDNDGSIFHL